MFFYELILIDPITNFLKKYYLFKTIRSYHIILIFTLISIFIIRNTSSIHLLMKYINTFFIFFTITLLPKVFNSEKMNSQIDKVDLISNYLPKKGSPSSKSTILIILDEYNSPLGLYEKFSDSSVFNFSIELQILGWQVNNSMFSFDTSTIHSLSSIFNFNLSSSGYYNKKPIVAIAKDYLLKSSLYDSLYSNKNRIINYGIFDFGNSKPLSNLYYYPKSFIDPFLIKSAYSKLPLFYQQLKFPEFKKITHLPELHNKIILTTLVDTLTKLKNQKSFTYVHLYMPHAPLLYSPDFINPYKSASENYLAYWKFTNTKVLDMIKKIMELKNYRIIISGDHGYRNDLKINPHLTFAAFWGFDSLDIKETIFSVQDYGKLINNAN